MHAAACVISTRSDRDHLKIFLASRAFGASPVHGHVFPFGARRNAVLGVAGGLFLWVVAQSWELVTRPLSFYPPASAVLAGLWLLPGVLGGLVLRV